MRHILHSNSKLKSYADVPKKICMKGEIWIGIIEYEFKKIRQRNWEQGSTSGRILAYKIGILSIPICLRKISDTSSFMNY
jgi:hypothetical protein